VSFERFIARRYLFSGQHKALVGMITFISIAGVALGVLALIVVISVMDGFDQNLQEKIIGANAHMEVARSYSNSPFLTTGALEMVRKLPGVKAAGPMVVRQALIQVPGAENRSRQTGVMITGLDLSIEPQITRITDYVRSGAKELGEGDIVMGEQLAMKSLFIPPGQKMRMVAPVWSDTEMGSSPLWRNVRVAGFFRTGFPETDGFIAYCSLETARNLFLIPEGEFDGIRATAADPDHLEDTAAAIQKALGPMYFVNTWKTRNAALFHMLKLEKAAMFVILLLIVVVAAFNIIGTLIMVVMEKTREIGILKSMGATDSAILRIFVNQGLIVGSLGTLIGTVGGLAICWFLKYKFQLPDTAAVYMSDHIPVVITPWMIALIIGCAMAIVLVASLYPARQASKLNPVEALRFE
jgi:lipoprotein-releasing system permease protein